MTSSYSIFNVLKRLLRPTTLPFALRRAVDGMEYPFPLVVREFRRCSPPLFCSSAWLFHVTRVFIFAFARSFVVSHGRVDLRVQPWSHKMDVSEAKQKQIVKRSSTDTRIEKDRNKGREKSMHCRLLNFRHVPVLARRFHKMYRAATLPASWSFCTMNLP